VGDVPLKVNFALSVPFLGAAAVLISVFTKFDESEVIFVLLLFF